MGRALVREPQVFLLDEPLSNLDAKLRGQVRAELKHLHQRLAITSIYVTHDQVEAMTLADRICVMNAGELQQVGTPQEVYDTPANAFVAGFMGSPAMNLLRVKVVDGYALLGEAKVARLPRGHDEVIVGIRPEACEVGPPSGAGISARVDFHEPLGSHVLVHAVVDDAVSDPINDSGTMVIQAAPHLRPAPGERLSLTVEPGRVFVFDATSGAVLDPAGDDLRRTVHET
jgi:sn-glycerol 3-phosphate transport system ATP-binding protein